MRQNTIPILQFDPTPTARLEPSLYLPANTLPERCVMHFFEEVTPRIVDTMGARELFVLHSAMGAHPVYGITVSGQDVAVFHTGVCAALVAGFMEELIALGCRRFTACGGSGVLDSSIPPGYALLPTGAIRDEGTSYHYLPAEEAVGPHPDALAAFREVLAAHEIPFREGLTWTTDAIFRETPDKIAYRRDVDGCMCVEMEAAAFFAVAQFRGVVMGQLLYGGDDVGSEVWDKRDWVIGNLSAREKLFLLALEACLKL